MANEITVNLSAAISSSGQSVSGTAQFIASLSATGFLGEEVTIGSSSAAVISLGGLSDPAVILVVNQDTTNFIQVDSASTLDKFPQKLLPGQAILLLPETGTIYAKADTAPCQAWIVVG